MNLKGMGFKTTLLILANLALTLAAYATEPELVIESPQGKIIYTRTQLLEQKSLTHIEVDEDPAYSGKKRVYTALPIYSLFDSISVSKNAILQFRCADGYAAPLPRDKVLNRNPRLAIAYLAIEEEKKWPSLDQHDPNKTAGPFYVIWVNPKASQVTKDDWPYQVVGFEVKKSLQESFPAIFPDPKLSDKSPIKKGFQVFASSCFTCHTMNLQGESKKGPDLNIPMNPTEYWQPKALHALIRNPQSVRHWPEGKMKGFKPSELSDQDIRNVIAYLKHMTKRKVISQ